MAWWFGLEFFLFGYFSHRATWKFCIRSRLHCRSVFSFGGVWVFNECYHFVAEETTSETQKFVLFLYAVRAGLKYFAFFCGIDFVTTNKLAMTVIIYCIWKNHMLWNRSLLSEHLHNWYMLPILLFTCSNWFT